MVNLLAALESFDPGQDYVLAVVMATDGSTYQKAGAMMLLDARLNYWGLISGGCLEGDIQENAATVLKTRTDQTLHYDMRGDEDLLWGMGLGCNGAVDLLLKFLPAADNHLGLFEVLTAQANGASFLMAIDTSNHHALRFIQQTDNPDPALKHQQPALEFNYRQRALEQDSTLWIQLPAPLSILICGGSPDVPPVCAIAAQLGWKTTVIDHRPAFAEADKFKAANQVLLIKRSQWRSFALESFDAAVIMSHQFERDKDYLARLIDSSINYIGLLGPSQRRDELLAHCATEFTAHEGRVFGPVGLDIGANSPETIALAIVAEIQAVQAKKSVGFCYQDETR